MRIPQHTLLREFEHLNPPPTGIPYVALLCPRCKNAGTYSEADLVESGVSGISPNWAGLDWLQCGEEGCTPRVPLFELRNTDQTSSILSLWKHGSTISHNAGKVWVSQVNYCPVFSILWCSACGHLLNVQWVGETPKEQAGPRLIVPN